ncbi:hypothetical protein BN2475_220071 [Paraburkholderia ribeironis]|uniref:Uncharacterized protein n=1 Tax=Paraburkholderia ribeironis TaxID=1247936 RepID=A0A1N7RXC2_9BURK|nr:hypothetical protein BN2475_220071 [Paraburkholderia ribeironis]
MRGIADGAAYALFKRNFTNGLDGLTSALHNSASLLLMQRRRPKRCQVVVEPGAVG